MDIAFPGLRSGEKLTEEVHFDNEDFQLVGYDKLFVLREAGETSNSLEGVDHFLRSVSHMEDEEVRERLKELVPEYQPTKYESPSQASADVFRIDSVEPLTMNTQSDN